MKLQPVAFRPHLYRAELRNDNVASRVLAEDTTLRGVITKISGLALSSMDDVSIETEIEGWTLPPNVPHQVFAVRQDRQWLLRPIESVPEHWDFPAPEVYFALDWQRGIYLEAPSLRSLVEGLHQVGHTFVHSEDMKIGARFAREDMEVDDVVQIPLSLVCYDYDPDGAGVIMIDQDWGEDHEDYRFPCSPLPLEAELLPAEMVEPHFLFADILRKQTRLKSLLES
jgi:hypothetical protein